MFQQQSRATFHSSSRLPPFPTSISLSVYLRPLSVSLSSFPSPSFFFFFSFFFISFRDPYPAVYFSPRLFEEIRGTTNGRGNETDNRTAVPSRGRICLPFGSRVVSGEGGEREREEEKVSRSRFIPTSLHAVCILLYPLSCSSIRPIFALKWSINICCLIAWKGNGIVLSSAKTERDDSEILFRYVTISGKRKRNNRVKFLRI